MEYRRYKVASIKRIINMPVSCSEYHDNHTYILTFQKEICEITQSNKGHIQCSLPNIDIVT